MNPFVKKPHQPQESQDASKEGARPRDVVLVHGVTEDKKGLRVLRAREQTIEAGEVRPLKEGQPITSDVVRLHARGGAPFVYDVETTYSPSHRSTQEDEHRSSGRSRHESESSPRPTHAGPAQVATQAYRENWDTIWAKVPLGKGSSELN